jgi:hypothetical protein
MIRNKLAVALTASALVVGTAAGAVATQTIGSDPNRYLDTYGNTVYAPRLHWELGTQCTTPGQVDCLVLSTAPDNTSGHDYYIRKMPNGQVCTFYKGQTYADNHDVCLPASFFRKH